MKSWKADFCLADFQEFESGRCGEKALASSAPQETVPMEQAGCRQKQWAGRLKIATDQQNIEFNIKMVVVCDVAG